jgi:hypothetical protein
VFIHRFDIPGYRELLNREQAVRDAVYVEPWSEEISRESNRYLPSWVCGVPVRQMTLRDLLLLTRLKSPFLSGGFPSPENVASFLGFLSPDYKEGRLWAWCFSFKHRKLKFEPAIAEIKEYLDDTFQDWPGGGGSNAYSFASAAAHFAHAMAGPAYRWPWRQAMLTPIKILCQQLNCINADRNPERTMMSARLLKLRGDDLRRKNAALQCKSKEAKN